MSIALPDSPADGRSFAPPESELPRSGPRTTSGAGWFAVTAGVLSGLTPLLLIASIPLSSDSSPTWVWALLVSVLVGLRYAWLVAMGARRLYELIFWLFTYVFLGLAPLAQMRAGRYAGTTPDLDTRLDGRAMLVVAVGTVAFSVGVALAGKRTRPSVGTSVPTEASMNRLLLLTVLALGLATYYVSKLGVGVLLSTRAQRTAAEALVWPDPTVQALVKALATLPLVVSLVALVRRRDSHARLGRSQPTLLPLLVLAVLVIVVNPVTSPRYVFGTAGLALVAAVGATATARRTRLLALLLAAGLVLVFPYAAAARRPTTTTNLSAGPATSLSGSDYDAFGQIVNIVAYVRDEGTTNGRQLAGAALFWVPRSSWPNKPRDSGILVADYRGYSFRNLSAPLVGEFFLNGGWKVLLVGMGLLGFGLRRLDARLVSASVRAPGNGALASLLPFYLIIVLRGSLLQSMAGLSVLALSAAFIAGDRRPATSRLPQSRIS